MAAASIPAITPALEARFWSKVARAGPDDCWCWTANSKPTGYGLFKVGVVQHKATHVALAIAGRPRPGDLWALHSCDNPRCVNPLHLRWGTDVENVADKIERDRCSRAGGARGEAHRHAKLSAEQVAAIRSSSLGYKALGRAYGVTREAIRAVRRGRTWAHVPEG